MTDCPVTAEECKQTNGRCTWKGVEGRCTKAAKPAAAATTGSEEPKEYYDDTDLVFGEDVH